MTWPLRIKVIGGLVLALVPMWPSLAEAASPIDNGLSCLAATQNPTGSWGDPNGTAFRDTTVVLDTLKLLGQTGVDYLQGIANLRNSIAPNHDYLARQIVTQAGAGNDVTDLLAKLLTGQTSESFVAAEPNYPEGGWGVGPGFATETLTTALALSALKASGLPTGLAVVRAVVQTGTQNTHQFTMPAGGSNLVIFVREVTGTVRLFIDTPSSGTFFVDLTNISSPVNIPGVPAQAGTYTLRVESRVGSPNTYSLEARFLAGSFDVSRITRALSYLGFAQNADASWGVSRGEDGHLMIAAEVLRALEGFGNSFAPRNVIDRGIDWLESRQNPDDGGFGSDLGVSTVYETALALLALLGGDRTSLAIVPARNFLQTTQQPNGCWNNDAYQTALAPRALSASCLLDVDNNGVVDVATDIVYIARRLLGLTPVPPSFRTLDPSIPSDVQIAANIDAAGSAFDVDMNGVVDVATDIVYIARHRLGLTPVPPSFRTLDPSIKPDSEISAAIDALCPS